MARRRRQRRGRGGARAPRAQFVELVAPRPHRELLVEAGDARGTWMRIVLRDGGARGV